MSTSRRGGPRALAGSGQSRSALAPHQSGAPFTRRSSEPRGESGFDPRGLRQRGIQTGHPVKRESIVVLHEQPERQDEGPCRLLVGPDVGRFPASVSRELEDRATSTCLVEEPGRGELVRLLIEELKRLQGVGEFLRTRRRRRPELRPTEVSVRSPRMLARRASAGSSVGSCGTSSLRKARSRIDRRSVALAHVDRRTQRVDRHEPLPVLGHDPSLLVERRQRICKDRSALRLRLN